MKLGPSALFKRQNIRIKILLGYTAALALAAIVGGLSIYQLDRVNDTVVRLTGHLTQERNLADKITVQIYRIRLYANQYILQGQRSSALTSYNQALAEAQTLLNDGDQIIIENSRASLLSTVRSNFDQLAAAFAEIVQILAARQELEMNVLSPNYAISMIQLALLRNSSFETLDFTSAHYASQVRDTFSQMEVNVNQYLATSDEAYAALAEAQYEQIRSSIDLLNASVQGEAERAWVREIAVAMQAYHDGFTRIKGLVARQRDLIDDMDIHGPAVEQNAVEITNSIHSEFTQQSLATTQLVSRTRSVLLTNILVVVAIGLAFGLALSGVITQPLRQMARAAHGIAAGALDQEVHVQSKDELGVLAEAFNHMTVQVSETLTQLKQTNESLQTIIDVSPLAIMLVDMDDIVRLWNPAAEMIFGWKAGEVIGQRLPIIPADREVEFRALTEQIVTSGKIVAQNLVRKRIDGTLIQVSLSSAPLHDSQGNLRGRMAILEDVTERERAAGEVQRLNAELEQRVSERTQQLEIANKELESFSYSVSHDLRAPLRAIDGFSRILQEEYTASIPSEAARLVQSVRSNAKQMGTLIDDLLRFSRLSRQALNKQSVDMDGLVRQALLTLAPDQDNRPLDITCGSLPACRGDAGLLLQVWVNLLSNALKFTRHRDAARIQIGCRNDENGEPVYFVGDNGVGFDMHYASKLFGVFQRLHSAEDFDGTGVGLALVQRIILRHGGKIWAEAQPEAGATFYFTVGRE